jgi:hypothetical protein
LIYENVHLLLLSIIQAKEGRGDERYTCDIRVDLCACTRVSIYLSATASLLLCVQRISDSPHSTLNGLDLRRKMWQISRNKDAKAERKDGGVAIAALITYSFQNIVTVKQCQSGSWTLLQYGRQRELCLDALKTRVLKVTQ